MAEIPMLHELPPRGREIVTAYVESTWAAGVAEGRRQVEAEYQEHHEVVRAIVTRLAETPPFDELADRRQQHDRASTQRTILKRRGIA